MKTTKRFVSLFLCILFSFAISSTAFADDGINGGGHDHDGCCGFETTGVALLSNRFLADNGEEGGTRGCGWHDASAWGYTGIGIFYVGSGSHNVIVGTLIQKCNYDIFDLKHVWTCKFCGVKTFEYINTVTGNHSISH